MDGVSSFLGRNGYLPHGYCFTWTPDLLWTMVGADTIITAAYFSIPVAIGVFLRKRRDPSLGMVAWFFCAFIFACGITHALDVWTIWTPDYGLQALAKVVTAALSIGTAIAIWRLIPQALKIPSVAELRSIIDQLEAEVKHRITVENHLAEVQQSLAVTLSSIGAGFIAVDRTGVVTRMNAIAEVVTGCAEDAARGSPLADVLTVAHSSSPFDRVRPIDAMINQRMTVDTSHKLIVTTAEGVRTNVELKAALTVGKDGEVNGAAIIFRDVTRLVRAENEADRLAAIVQSSNDAIVGKTLEGLISTWNPAAERLLGYTAAEAIGKPVQMLIPEDRYHEEMPIIAHVQRGEAMPAYDTLRLAKDGSLVDVSLSVSPIFNAQGQITGASKTFRSLSLERQAEAALRETREQARLVTERLEAENRQILEASRTKNQFLANMSHELRTPLNSIIGFADLLHDKQIPYGSPRFDTFLGHIGSSGRHLLQLINGVLDLAKVEAGKFEFFPEPIDLAGLVAETIDVLHTAFRQKQLEVVVEVDPTLSSIVTDPARLKQVLYNYLSNAIKFTPEHGCVKLIAAAEGLDRFRVSVTDTGIGISEENLPKLFVEFQQLDSGNDRLHEGTGLGLALTRKLVEAQGGSIGVRSTLGVGSTFYAVLDRVAVSEAEPSSEEFDDRFSITAEHGAVLQLQT